MSARSGVPGVLLAVVFSCAMAFAGCVQPGQQEQREEERDHGHPDPLTRSELAGLEPAWFPGLVFTYQVEHPPTGSSAVVDFVVLDGPGTDWTLDPLDDEEDQQAALSWALYWGLPVGAVDFQEYEPQREGEAMDWFSFPIEESQSWQGTAPDGSEVTFRAQAEELTLPEGGTSQGYRVTGKRDGVQILEYTYTSEVGWFVSLRFDATQDGDPEVVMDLQGMGVKPALTERPLRALERFVDLQIEEVDQDGPSIDPGWPLVQQTFEVPSPSDYTYWLVRYSHGSSAYQANVSFEGGKGWEAAGIPHGSGPSDEHTWGRLIPGRAEGDARIVLLGEGSVHLVGLQLAPRE